MTLSDYLKLGRISRREFASALGVSVTAVTRYLSGDRLPHPWVMQRIEEVTQGGVTPADLIRFHMSLGKKHRQFLDRQDSTTLAHSQEG